ncbi:ZrgA family zinc uptake protein [Fluviispira multicolorata]|nr:DUF2796 domain-containing protein [Fluviispira multicolorata]
MFLNIHKIFLPILLGMTSIFAYAFGAHEHGTAKIDIALQDKEGTIYIKVPSESIYNFEHEAKTDVEKKNVKIASEKIKKNILQIVRFDPSLECSITGEKINPFAVDPNDDEHDEDDAIEEKSDHKKHGKHGKHGNFQAEFKFKCNKDATGSKISFGFTNYFPKVQKAIIQLNSDKKQTSVTVSKDKGYIQL